MKNYLPFITVILLSAFFFACNSRTETAVAGQYVITNVSVIPMTSDTVLQNMDVFIDNDIITSVKSHGEKTIAKNIQQIDGKGKFLIPGLTEMHAHVPGGDDVTAMKDVLELFLLRGVTTIRTMQGDPHHLQLKKDVEDKKIAGPVFYTSAPALHGGNVKTKAAADSLVSLYKSQGYDHLKILPGLSLENFKAIAAKANALQIPFAGHVPADVGVWNAIEAGYSTIDHLDGFVEALVPGIENISQNDRGIFGLHIAYKADQSRIDTLVKALKEKNIWVVPTECLPYRWFSALPDAASFAAEPEMKFMDPAILQRWVGTKNNLLKDALYKPENAEAMIELRKKILKACQDNGVGILAGSDAPQVFDVPGFSTAHELFYMSKAGLSNFQVLQTATTHVARYYNIKNGGTIQEGSPARLVLLNRNPLENIEATKNVVSVVANGSYYSLEEINKRLERLKGKIKQN